MSPKILKHPERKLVLENFFSLSILQGLSYVLPLLILPYLIRVIGAERFGLIAFAQAFVHYFMILTDYGFSLTASRRISLHKDKKHKVKTIFSSVMTVKIILTAFSFLVMLLIIQSVPRFRQDWLVYMFSFGAVTGNILFPTWLFQGAERMKYVTAINVIGGLIYTACIFIFVKTTANYIYVPLLNSILALGTGIAGMIIAFRKFGLEFVEQPFELIQEEFKTGWSVFVSVIAINAYTSTRIFAMGLLTNNILTGYYSIAERIAYFIQTFPLDSFSQAIYPRLNRIYHKNKNRALKLMRKIQTSTTITYVIAIPTIILLAPWIVQIICGQKFETVILNLRLLLIAVFFVCSNAFRIQFLLVCNRQDIYSKLHLAAAIVGLPLIFIFVFLFSYPGVAISAITIEFAILLVTKHTIKKYSIY